MTPSVDLFGREHMVVVSPHFDDAALSLGSTIARASQAGSTVTIVTVLGGDPASAIPAGRWDLRCGFSSAGEAARKRRAEDSRACEILGALPVWLPFGDEQYDRGGTDEEIWQAVAPSLSGADLILLPGYPLTHLDHAWLTRMILERRTSGPTALYVEQPYAANVTIGRGYSPRPFLVAARIACSTGWGRRPRSLPLPSAISSALTQPVDWVTIRPTRLERQLKADSIKAYASQVDGLGRRLLTRLRLYESVSGGERVGFLE